MELLNNILIETSNILWSIVLVPLLIGTGIYLTIRLGGIQFYGMKHGIQVTTGKFDNPLDAGDVNHFQALSAALSATIGIGNIAGVAWAVQMGGPGALFWMWVTAVVGMATKFTCCALAVKHRQVNPDGTISGGPMFYIKLGLGSKWAWLATAFAFFAAVAAFGTGNMAQAGELSNALAGLTGLSWMVTERWDLFKTLAGVVIAVMVGLVIIGGIRRIGQVASRLVPFMCILYVSAALIIIIAHIAQVPDAFAQVFSGAFGWDSAEGGFLGSAFILAMQWGVRRGLFSNESGQGSAPIAHAAAKTEFPIREGYVAMLGPFIDTLIVCSMTGLVIIVTGVMDQIDPEVIKGADLTGVAFNIGLGKIHPFFASHNIGQLFVTFGVILFAFSTAISWSYYGDRSISYLLGLKAVPVYRWVFCGFLVLGATIKIDLVWNLCDIFNGMMAIPNLVGLIFLVGVLSVDLKAYNERIPEFLEKIKKAKID